MLEEQKKWALRLFGTGEFYDADTFLKRPKDLSDRIEEKKNASNLCKRKSKRKKRPSPNEKTPPQKETILLSTYPNLQQAKAKNDLLKRV